MLHVLGGELAPIVVPADALAQLEIPDHSVIRNAPFRSQGGFVLTVITVRVNHELHGHAVIHHARTGHLAVQHRLQGRRVQHHDEPFRNQLSFLLDRRGSRPGRGFQHRRALCRGGQGSGGNRRIGRPHYRSIGRRFHLRSRRSCRCLLNRGRGLFGPATRHQENREGQGCDQSDCRKFQLPSD